MPNPAARPRRVELHQAFVWACEDCGRDNFCRAVAVELTPAQRREMAAEISAYDEDLAEYTVGGGTWMTAPEEVTCAHCHAEFRTVDSRGDCRGESPDGPSDTPSDTPSDPPNDPAGR